MSGLGGPSEPARGRTMWHVRFGSLAVVQHLTTLRSAFGGKADVRNAEIHEI